MDAAERVTHRLQLTRAQRALSDLQRAKTARERARITAVSMKKACREGVLLLLRAVFFNPLLLGLWVRMLKGRVEFFGNSHAIGDLAAADYYLQRKLHLNSRVVSVYLINQPHLANEYLARFYAEALGTPRTIFVLNRFLCRLLKPLEYPLSFVHSIRDDPFFAGPKAHCMQTPPEYHALRERYNLHLERKLPVSERHRARALMEALGLPRDATFVCVHAREAGFKAHFQPTGHNTYRDVDIATYIPAIDYLTRQGFWVVRLGEATVKPLPRMDRVIDYARHPAKSDFLDIALIAECELFIGCTSGLGYVAHLFNKPSLSTNTIPLLIAIFSGSEGLWIPKLLYDQRQQRYLTYPEVFRFGIAGFEHSQDYAMANIEVRANSAQDILEAAQELHQHYLGRPGYSEEDLREQRRFNQLIPPHGTSFGTRSRLCVSFIRNHRDLMPPVDGTHPELVPSLSGAVA